MLADGMSMYGVAKAMDVDRKVIVKLRRGETYKELERPAALRAAS
jgi:hypothetical protein